MRLVNIRNIHTNDSPLTQLINTVNWLVSRFLIINTIIGQLMSAPWLTPGSY